MEKARKYLYRKGARRVSLVAGSYVTVWGADCWVIVAIPIRFASSVKPPRRATRTARSTTWGEYRRSVDPNALLALINRLSLAVHLPTGTLARASLLVPSSTTRSNCTTRGTRKPPVISFSGVRALILASSQSKMLERSRTERQARSVLWDEQ